MPPPKQACELILNFQLATLKICRTIAKIASGMSALARKEMKLKFGLIDIADIVGAEMVAAIGSVAASTGKAMLGAISGMASALFESILSALLSILLSFPTAIFSLIAIPHDQAVKAAHKERLMLNRAKRNLRTILRIIFKWTKGFGSTKFYEQMKDALPYIQKAIDLSVDLLKGLEGYDGASGDVPNAQFNENKYKSMQRNITRAINITQPHSIIDRRMQITKRVEASRQDHYDQAATVINAKYDKRRSVISKAYKKSLAEARQSGESLKSALDIEEARSRYAIGLKILETQRKEALHLAELKAAAKATADKSAYAKAIGGIAAEFIEDMENLGKNLEDFVKNIKDAFLAYKRCQNLCNAMYRIRELITRMINEMIEMLRNAGNASAKVAIGALEGAQDILEVTKDEFVDSISRFEDSSRSISAIALSSSVVKGHSLLNTADAILNASITESLIDMINSDDVLSSGNKAFEEFYDSLERIPDWDGKSVGGVTLWATNPTSAAISPYPKIISDAIKVLTKVPVLSLSNTQAGQVEVIAIVSDINRTFGALFVHNSEVKSVLNSYRPYMTSEAGNLKRILSNAGLLETFATGMSVAAVLTDIISASGGDLFDDTFPSYTNCYAHYRELYDNQDAAIADAYTRTDMSVRPSYEAQRNNEEVSRQRSGVINVFKNHSMDHVLTPTNLKSPPESKASSVQPPSGF